MKLPERIVLATRNQKKLKEMRAILSDLGVEVLSVGDFANVLEVVEDRATFEENAAKKAVEVSAVTGIPAVADDSGLVVDALDGRPGVMSARYAGEGAADAQLIEKLLDEMRCVPEGRRGAHFRCAVAYAEPDAGLIFGVSGRCDGIIAFAPRGSNGFGYDPVFFHPESGMSFAELPSEIKNRISHRARALAAFKEKLKGRAHCG
ncbi:MAG TPA: XTP/dITP diphosphatase [Candidatus Brocadiia bacterium]|nr:XTP/dITP diphosphatase [Candidatus Brocadiia bacterium]